MSVTRRGEKNCYLIVCEGYIPCCSAAYLKLYTVKCNIGCFLPEFMFRLTQTEYDNLKLQFANQVREEDINFHLVETPSKPKRKIGFHPYKKRRQPLYSVDSQH
jgi:hypothetical protein